VYNQNEQSYLRSPPFDFTGFQSDPDLTLRMSGETEVCINSLFIQSVIRLCFLPSVHFCDKSDNTTQNFSLTLMLFLSNFKG
jgi:hypothetical protein